MKRLIFIVLLLLSALSVQATPIFRSIGAVATGVGAITPALPAGHVANDILLCFVESSNETISTPTNSGSGTWALIGSQQGTGTAASVNSVRGAVYWMRDDGTSIGTVTIADSGDHTFAVILAYSNCITTGTPYVAAEGQVITTAQTNPTFAAVTPNVLLKGGRLLTIIFNGFDSATAVGQNAVSSTGSMVIGSGVTRTPTNNTSGTGGGYATRDSTYDNVDGTGTYTYSATYANSTLYAGISFILKPIAAGPNNFFDFIYKSTP